MPKITDALRADLIQHPERQRAVVITLVEGGDLGALAPASLAPIPGVPDVYSARMSGSSLLQLVDHPAIAEISEDFSVGIF